MSEGRLLEKGPCKDLIANPESEYNKFKKGK
jgi:ABC-type microcin C transport system duplicated ATPase subunit YejF